MKDRKKGRRECYRTECLNDPYEHMYLNCEKMTKEMVRQGRPKDNIVKAFSAPMWEWNRPRDGRWPHSFRT